MWQFCTRYTTLLSLSHIETLHLDGLKFSKVKPLQDRHFYKLEFFTNDGEETREGYRHRALIDVNQTVHMCR